MRTLISDSVTNSQGEKIEIRRVNSGDFEGQYVIVIHDDPEVSNIKAAHLLDKETIDWLKATLEALEKAK